MITERECLSYSVDLQCIAKIFCSVTVDFIDTEKVQYCKCLYEIKEGIILNIEKAAILHYYVAMHCLDILFLHLRFYYWQD